METEIVLQPILKDSQIPFDKYLLLYDGNLAMTGKLIAITKEGYKFSRIGSFNVFDLMFGEYDTSFIPTHYAILNIVLQK